MCHFELINSVICSNSVGSEIDTMCDHHIIFEKSEQVLFEFLDLKSTPISPT